MSSDCTDRVGSHSLAEKGDVHTPLAAAAEIGAPKLMSLGRFELPASRNRYKPQRDDLTTNRQGLEK